MFDDILENLFQLARHIDEILNSYKLSEYEGSHVSQWLLRLSPTLYPPGAICFRAKTPDRIIAVALYLGYTKCYY
jgi:hypothetical protein